MINSKRHSENEDVLSYMFGSSKHANTEFNNGETADSLTKLMQNLSVYTSGIDIATNIDIENIKDDPDPVVPVPAPVHKYSNPKRASSVTETCLIYEKIKCIEYLDKLDYAKIFVEDIIQMSVDVCQKLIEATFGEDSSPDQDSCICLLTPEDSKVEIIPWTDKNNKSDGVHIATKVFISNYEKKFSGWPTIDQFSIPTGVARIAEFMGEWHYDEDWKYSISFMANYSDLHADFFLYEAMWSIPMKEYPVAQATASIFFNVEVSRVKPKNCLVSVTLQFERSRCIYNAGEFEFMENWLFNIIDAKLNFYKTLTF